MTKAADTSTDLAIPVRRSTDMESVIELDQIIRGQRNAPPPEVGTDDPAEISREIVSQILDSETVEDVFSVVGNATGWLELEGVPIEIDGFRWRPSDYEEGAPVYLIVTGTRLDTGEAVALTTGSLNVEAQLVALAKQGRLTGQRVALRQADKQTTKGFRPQHLVRVQEALPAAAATNVPLEGVVSGTAASAA